MDLFGCQSSLLTYSYFLNPLPFISLFSQLLQGVILPDLPKVLPRQKRVVAAGLSRLLLASNEMLQQSNLVSVYPATLTALLAMVNDQSISTSLSSRDAAIDADEIFLQDWEDQSVGASSSYAVLKSSTTPHTRVDMTRFLGGRDVRQYLGQGLKELNARQGQKVSS
jgi:exportin-2 (importin alpha re-exporter)